MKACIVTAHMLSPVATRDAIHLDAIVIDSVARRRGMGSVSRSGSAMGIPRVPTPIPRLSVLGASAYLCTAARFLDHRVGMERLTKKKDEVDIHVRSGAWKVSAGPDRLYCVPISTIETRQVSWMCGGSRRQLRMAVRSVRHIGIMRRHGYGSVRDWELEEIDVDPQRLLVDDEFADRHLPAAWCAGSSGEDFGAVLPPYWHPGRSIQRVRFGHRATLRDEVVEALEDWR